MHTVIVTSWIIVNTHPEETHLLSELSQVLFEHILTISCSLNGFETLIIAKYFYCFPAPKERP